MTILYNAPGYTPLVLVLLLFACAARAPIQPEDPGLDVVVVPGCPTTDDGRITHCLARRTLWAGRLYELGVAPRFITSGNAVYNRYIEAEALAAGLVDLGVPPDRITLEPHALHTDENMGYALQIAQARGWERIGVASDGSHARGGCAMLERWGHDCEALTMDLGWLRRRLKEPWPDIEIQPVPDDEWLPLRERERRIAEIRGKRRPNSILYYTWYSLPWARSVPPTVPEGGWLAVEPATAHEAPPADDPPQR